MNYQQLADDILNAFQGKENVVQVTHCITRLRVTAVDPSHVNRTALQNMEGVQGLIEQDNELQVIIGTDVMNVYNEFIKLIDDAPQQMKKAAGTAKRKPLEVVLKYLSGSIVPVMPILCCAAVIGTVCTVLSTFFNFSPESGTYIIFNTFYNAFYDFLPIFIGCSAAKVLGINQFYGAFLGAIMVHGNISGAKGLDFFGLQLPVMTYQSTIVPILLGTAFMAAVDRFIGTKIPRVIAFIFRPFVVLAITVPVTLLVLGPLGTYAGNYVAMGISWIFDVFGVFAIAILGFVFPLLIASGMGNAVLPIFLQLFLVNGYEGFLIPASLSANLAVGGAVLAVAVKAKQNTKKQAAAAAGFTALCGITEPAIYGMALPMKRPLLAGMIGGAAGGLTAGLLGVKMYAFNAAGIVTLPLFLAPDGSMTNFYFAVLVAVLSAIIGFLISYIMGFEEEEAAA